MVDAPQRTANLFQLVQTLKRLSSQLKLAVIVINQVTGPSSSMDLLNIDQVYPHRYERDGHVHAALGSSWHHCVTTRLLLEHDRQVYTRDGNNLGRHEEVICIRRATVVKSNVAPRSTMLFEIKCSGLHEWAFL